MRTRTILILLATTLGLAGCADAEGRDDADDSTGADETTGGDDATATVTATSATTIPTTSATSVTSATTSPETDGEDETGAPSEFDFDDAPPEDYTRVDRMGMPAVATALIVMKDAYNEGNPVDDSEGLFVSEIVERLDFLHTALDDDLANAGLTPCAVDLCVAQGSPLVLPDTLKIDLTGAPGFPNGRRPSDPVIDLTLAVILLDLSVHDVTTLVELPLNPPEGDKELPAEFPFFATPHG